MDYLALDLSDADAVSLKNTLSRLENIIKKYNMRIIVSDTLTSAEDILDEYELVNFMKVPQ